MGREKQTAVRYPSDIMDRLTALIGPTSTAMHEATMSDVLRTVVAAGLPIVEEAYRVKPPVSMADPMKPERLAEDADRGRLARGGGQGRKWVGK